MPHLCAELAEVVDLAVEDQRVAAAAKYHRLMPALGEVQNGQPSEAQPAAGGAGFAHVIRPPMDDAIKRRRTPQPFGLQPGSALISAPSKESTHRLRPELKAEAVSATMRKWREPA